MAAEIKSPPRFETPADLALEVDALMSRLSSAVLDAQALGSRVVYEKLSEAWSAAFDARAILESMSS